MNIGVIGIHGAWSTEALSRQLQRKSAGGAVIGFQELSYDLDQNKARHPRHQLDHFDGFIIKKMGREYSPHLLDELELLEHLERGGYCFFSSPRRLREMISRLSCTIRLRENHIPMPPTFISEDPEAAIAWVLENGPAVLKPLYSTKARGMSLVSGRQDTLDAIAGLTSRGEKIIYLQQKYDLSGSDYGLVFLGAEYIGAYARVSDGSAWHTTTRAGGSYRRFEPPKEFIDLAVRAQAPFGLDFTCVDIADTKEAGPVVFEVSAFGGYKGLYESAGLDASDLLTDYVIGRLS